MQFPVKSAATLVAAAIASSALAAETERYPSRPIRVVVPFTPGGSNDLIGRIIGTKLTESWGQPVIIDNRPGGGSTIGVHVVVNAAPDGYTLLTTSGGIATSVSLYKLPYDPVKDLAPVALLAQMPYLLAAHPGLAAKTTQDLINLAKAQPGKIAFSSSGAGTSSHLAAEMFKSAAKIEMLHVAYKGGGPAVNAVMSGEVQLTFNVITGPLPQVRAGKLRAIAVTSPKRSEVAPDIPTVAESGLPGFEMLAWYNMFAPARTPRPIIDRLNGEVNRILREPEVRERMLTLGVTPMTSTPADLAKYLRYEIDRWAKVIKEAGIKLN
jgi:tripartite-type tricarboxylate transporter receptor subunit TctC